MSDYVRLGGHIVDAQRVARRILDGLRGGKRTAQIFAVQRHLYEAGEAMHRDPPKAGSSQLTDVQIKYMVDRFLGWKLPENFNPDGGVSFKKLGNESTPHQYEHRPSGTNLFGATQADAMVRYMIDGMPGPLIDVQPGEQGR